MDIQVTHHELCLMPNTCNVPHSRSYMVTCGVAVHRFSCVLVGYGGLFLAKSRALEFEKKPWRELGVDPVAFAAHTAVARLSVAFVDEVFINVVFEPHVCP
jgi:hypothetical protein